MILVVLVKLSCLPVSERILNCDVIVDCVQRQGFNSKYKLIRWYYYHSGVDIEPYPPASTETCCRESAQVKVQHSRYVRGSRKKDTIL